MMDIEFLNKPEKLEDKFQKIKMLGEGTYGHVTKCIDKHSKDIVAVKKIKLEIFQGDGFPSSSMREISTLKKMKHENIVFLKDVQFQFDENSLLMVFECLECDLKQYLENEFPIQPIKIKQIMKQILQGVDYCHQMQIMHRDLKPQNILISSKTSNAMQVKISDFGLARTFTTPLDKYTKEIATLWYRAPEVMLGDEHYSITIDIWAIGCIFIELLTKKPPFHAQSQIDQLFQIFQIFGTPNEQNYPGISKLPDYNEKFPKFQAQGIQKLLPSNFNDPEALDLLQNLLVLDPSKRMFSKEALKHPYFSGV
ncbi:hypothetical protein ABPG74_015580 [Tetrahymena malaccensis]